MTAAVDSVLDCPVHEVPDPQELIEAAMRWHFSPRTGSPFWLRRASSLDFDPLRDVHTVADLRMFPAIGDDLRWMRAEELIPRGYGSPAPVVGIYESGGTTGAPKRVVLLRDWMRRTVHSVVRDLERHGIPPGLNWLALVPTGPHAVGLMNHEQARTGGGIAFHVDLDPRWVKKCLSDHRVDEVDRYVDHLLAQSEFLLDTQDIGLLATTPPLLERIARNDRLVELINKKVRAILWAGAHMDADTRHLLRTEVFPDAAFVGVYGNTMFMGGVVERAGLTADDPCVFDPFSPFITFEVVDPETGEPVGYGERGRVLTHHVSKSLLLPNNLERDVATRVLPPAGRVGDSIADVVPVATFEGEAVIEGVY